VLVQVGGGAGAGQAVGDPDVHDHQLSILLTGELSRVMDHRLT
jgi:hypothetical protein